MGQSGGDLDGDPGAETTAPPEAPQELRGPGISDRHHPYRCLYARCCHASSAIASQALLPAEHGYVKYHKGKPHRGDLLVLQPLQRNTKVIGISI